MQTTAASWFPPSTPLSSLLDPRVARELGVVGVPPQALSAIPSVTLTATPAAASVRTETPNASCEST